MTLKYRSLVICYNLPITVVTSRTSATVTFIESSSKLSRCGLLNNTLALHYVIIYSKAIAFTTIWNKSFALKICLFSLLVTWNDSQCTVAGMVFLKSAFWPWSFLALKLSIFELESWFFVYRDIFWVVKIPQYCKLAPLMKISQIMTFLVLKSDHVMAWDCMVGTCTVYLNQYEKGI